jgi:hypothetical protein
MKPNKNLLNAELQKTRKLMEDISIVNKSDLDKAGNWNVSHILRKKEGLTTYEKNGYELIQRDDFPEPRAARHWSYRGKRLVYMLPEQADELNALGQQIREMIKEYNEKYNQYVKE